MGIYYRWSGTEGRRRFSEPLDSDRFYYPQYEYDDERGWSLRGAAKRGDEILSNLKRLDGHAVWRFVLAKEHGMSEETKKHLRKIGQEKKEIKMKEPKTPATFIVVGESPEGRRFRAVYDVLKNVSKPATYDEILAMLEKAGTLKDARLRATVVYHVNKMVASGTIRTGDGAPLPQATTTTAKKKVVIRKKTITKRKNEGPRY